MKKLFKKIFRGMKKIFKPIGRELKRGLKGVGKFFGKLGPIGTLALSLILPGVGTALGSLGTVAGNIAATAPFQGTIFGPLGKIISGVAKVATKAGGVYNSVSQFVGNTINGLTGGSFKGEMIPKLDAAGKATGEMIANKNYIQGYSSKFGDWVSQKLDNTRRYFGMETSMDEKGFEQALKTNEEAVGGLMTPSEIKNYAQSTQGQIEKSLSTFDINKKPTPGISDEGYKLPTQSEASLLSPSTEAIQASQRVQELMGPNRDAIIGEDISKTFSTKGADLSNVYRETIDVPIGFEKKTPDPLSKFVTDETPYYEYDLKTKTVFKDQLTDAQIEAIDIENTDYYAKFQNNRVDKIKTYINTNYKDSQGAFTEKYKDLTSDMLERAVLGEDVKAIGPTSALVGSILSPQEEEKGTGSQVHIPALPTSTELNRYEGGVSDAYRALGYKGPQNMAGFHMAGAYGNTPYNFMQNRIAMPQLTTAMPQLG